MKKLSFALIILALAATSAFSAVKTSQFNVDDKHTTETLFQEYEVIKKRMEEDQKNLLRLEGAISILQMNADAKSTTATETQTTATARN